MQPNLEHPSEIHEAEDGLSWDAFVAELADDDGQAAQEHLAAGFPVYFREDDTPNGLVIKQYPDGRRELIGLEQGEEKVVRSIS